MLLSEVTVKPINDEKDADFIENLASENKLKVEKMYVSRLNPKNRIKEKDFIFKDTNIAGGFQIELKITGDDNKIDFVKYLFDKRMNDVKHLNKCMSIAWG